MTAGDVVTALDGSRITLVGVGSRVIADSDRVRVWDIRLEAGEIHPWHLHGNPYVVLSIVGSTGRMDWLDGSEPRNISEYTGGTVFRPVSPIHRLTNTGPGRYRNRLIELKDLGENRAAGVLDVGSGARSTKGEPPSGMPAPPDGRRPVLGTEWVRVWTVTVPAGSKRTLQLDDTRHVIAEIDGDLEGPDLAASVCETDAAVHRIVNDTSRERTWFVVALDYLSPDLLHSADDGIDRRG